ncbi:MAG: diguanylate cyclase, partial [Clostridia bacterium]|nr:diguanylate cyclase [Clostridia bacterium]MBR6185295.1 diguanylate cyclase [Clostridia bacterium]
MLASALYAEVYLICIIIVVLLLLWNRNNVSRSTMEQWLSRVFVSFLICFGGNFIFTLLNSGMIPLPRKLPFTRLLKDVYYIGLVLGVFSWCGYGETLLNLENRKRSGYLYLLLGIIPLGIIVANHWNQLLFTVTEDGKYTRFSYYSFFMLFLIGASFVVAVRLTLSSQREFDPSRRAHKLIVASFPLSLLIAWMFSALTESLPVVCVAMMLELLCLYVGTNRQQISMDKLTQVNNRQNLTSFINYKLYDHVSRLYLLMIDVDYFKT